MLAGLQLGTKTEGVFDMPAMATPSEGAGGLP